MSSALAHHYFGGKDQIFVSAMQQILRDFGAEVREALKEAPTPRSRVDALLTASFAPTCFAPATISAWMTLYAAAQSNPETLRLLKVYQARLRSNLVHALRPISTTPLVQAEIIAALIDGLYLRAAVANPENADAARDVARQAVSKLLEEPI
jgi:TetR/AcrR family transcriptional repressor of bet genes